MQDTLTHLAPEQMEAILPGDQENQAKVEAADGVFEDGLEKVEDEEEDEGEDGGRLTEGQDPRYTGESMWVEFLLTRKLFCWRITSIFFVDSLIILLTC